MEQQVRAILRDRSLDRVAAIDNVPDEWKQIRGRIEQQERDRWRHEGKEEGK